MRDHHIADQSETKADRISIGVRLAILDWLARLLRVQLHYEGFPIGGPARNIPSEDCC
jgi:hypothetical protein